MMRVFDIALTIIVRQRGTDMDDAVDRAIDNLELREGNTFVASGHPVPYAAEAGPASLLQRPLIVMAKATS